MGTTPSSAFQSWRRKRKPKSLRLPKNKTLEEVLPNFKVLILGSHGVGKSSIFKRFLTNAFEDDTTSDTSVNIGIKAIKLQDFTQATLEVWDVPHHDFISSDEASSRATAVSTSYLENAQFIVLVYDYENIRSVEYVKAYYEALVSTTGGIPMLVVGNKCDLMIRTTGPTLEESKTAIDTTSVVALKVSKWLSTVPATSSLLIQNEAIKVSAKSNTGILTAFKTILVYLLEK